MRKATITGLAIFTVLIVPILVSGMGEAVKVRKTAPETADRQLADGLVGAVLQAYMNFSIPSFMDLVSYDYSPDRMQLVNSIGDSFYKALVVNIDYFVNKVTVGEDTLAVLFKWQKSVQIKSTGRSVNTEGNATFVFKNMEGGWKLIRIRGKNPML